MAGKIVYKGVKSLLHEKPQDKEPTKQRTTFYIDKTVYRRFQRLCKKRHKSISEVVEAALLDILHDEREPK